MSILTAHTIAAKRAYLSADTDLAANWRAEFAADKRLRVALVWSGSEGHQRNMFPSGGIERHAKAFAGIENVALFSLQKDASGAVSTAPDAGFEIADRTGKFATFDATAALGRPTWILLDTNSHWVWQRERTDSPWYPTATLYRQKEFSTCEPVMACVARDLAALAATHTGTAPRKRAAKKAAA